MRTNGAKIMIEEVTNHSGSIILTLTTAYISIMSYLVRVLFKKVTKDDAETKHLTVEYIDKRIDEKICAKTGILEAKIDTISVNINKIMEAIFKDIHLVK
jgi:hypothetical protein